MVLRSDPFDLAAEPRAFIEFTKDGNRWHLNRTRLSSHCFAEPFSALRRHNKPNLAAQSQAEERSLQTVRSAMN
jgi:hypothetical protein